MKTRHAVVVLAALTLTLTACGSEPEKTPAPIAPLPTTVAPVASGSPSTPGVYKPTDTGISQSTGVEVTILSVEQVAHKYGTLTVFTFQLHNGSGKIFEGYNWPTPTVVYGPAGVPAKQQYSGEDGFGDGVQGVITPGSKQTVRHAYQVAKADLNPAVVSVGSVVWQGDWTAFAR